MGSSPTGPTGDIPEADPTPGLAQGPGRLPAGPCGVRHARLLAATAQAEGRGRSQHRQARRDREGRTVPARHRAGTGQAALGVEHGRDDRNAEYRAELLQRVQGVAAFPSSAGEAAFSPAAVTHGRAIEIPTPATTNGRT